MKLVFHYHYVLVWGKFAFFVFIYRMVMPAWDEGIIGMKVGGKRKIICTPDKAYLCCLQLIV